MDWSGWLELKKLYGVLEAVLEPVLVAPEAAMPEGARAGSRLDLADRAVIYAAQAYRMRHSDGVAMTFEQQAQLRACWSDPRVQNLHPHQRHLLLFMTACAWAQWQVDPTQKAPTEASRLLSTALELSRHVWIPSEWQEWMGPRPLERRRQAVWALSEQAVALDASGDPEEPVVAWNLEPANDSRQPVPLRYVLEGINVWQDVVQTHLALKLGQWHEPQRVLETLIVQSPDHRLEVQQVLAWLERMDESGRMVG